MKTIALPKKLFVKSRECGSRFINSTGQIIDKNTCFWNCLYVYITNTLKRNDINIAKLKYDTTTDLPFGNILVGNQDPSLKGNLADHRVIQKTVEMFNMNIYLLTSGTHIYEFRSYGSEFTMCLFLHKNHFTLVEDELYVQRMLSVSKDPNCIFTFQTISSNKRRKRGKNNDGTYKSALIKGDQCQWKTNIFEESLKDTPKGVVLFEKVKRKRGKRRSKK